MNYDTDCLNRFATLWSATAREGDDTTPQPGPTDCDVAVIGAGYTGLATAIGLARAGTDVVVIDGGCPGWGGSGRNSGAVIRGFKNSRSKLIAEFGEARGRALAEFGATNTAPVYDLIDRYNIDCDLLRTGWILAAHNEKGLAQTAERQRTWTADGVAGLEILTPADLTPMLGSSAYVGGMIDLEGASINPLSYARGLARAAMTEGARVYSRTEALSYARDGKGWRIETPRGSITCREIVVATNAYSKDLVPSVARSLVTVHTNIVCTGVLPDDVADSILPGEQAVSDARRILYYWHKTPDRRVLFGTRGQMSGPSGTDSFAHVERAMQSVYPQLAGQPIEFRWAGRVGLTRDFLPHIDRPEPGLWTAHGYCGRGVAMATAYGQLIARAMLEGMRQQDLPVPNDPAPGLPPSPIKEAGVYATTQFYRLLDRLER